MTRDEARRIAVKKLPGLLRARDVSLLM